jgi:NCAIR mutase (PurE)-related protein
MDSLNLDLDRARRCGFPEVIFGQGKTVEEVVAAATLIAGHHGRVLVTRAAPEALAALTVALPQGQAHPRSRCFLVGMPPAHLGPVAVVSAGTADEPVAEECALTLGLAGVEVDRIRDSGVAGLHRLLGNLERIRACRVVVVIAGMEGALPSVVGGLIDAPVIGVPTSIGYGVAEGGRTALFAMLTSCAAGITVVNIDNGFGAGMAAAAMCRQIARRD